MKNIFPKQNGQAMVEFLITASFILIPLFLMIPLLGKYIELQQLSVQAARYQAWEYTAWFANNGSIPANFNPSPAGGIKKAIKSQTNVKNESYQRFFSDTSSPITSLDYLGWQTSKANPYLVDHSGQNLYTNSSGGTLKYNQPTPDLTANLPIPLVQGKGVVNMMIDVVKFIPSILNKLLSFLGVPSFSVLNSNGYQQSEVKIPILNAPNYTDIHTNRPLFERTLNLSTNAKAAVLTEGWSSGGAEHARTEAKSLVFTSVLNKPFSFLASALAILPFPGTKDLTYLDWGHTDSEGIPPEYLSPSGDTSCDSKGYCSY